MHTQLKRHQRCPLVQTSSIDLKDSLRSYARQALAILGADALYNKKLFSQRQAMWWHTAAEVTRSVDC